METEHVTTQDNIHSDQNEPFDGIKEDRKQPPPLYFNILFYGSIIWAILFCGYYLFSGWSSHDEFQEKMTTHQEQAAQEMKKGK